MAIKGTVVSLSASIGTLINGNLGIGVLNVSMLNIDSGTAYLGSVDVGTIATGYRVLPGAAVSLTLASGEIIYGIVPTGTVQMAMLLQGVP